MLSERIFLPKIRNPAISGGIAGDREKVFQIILLKIRKTGQFGCIAVRKEKRPSERRTYKVWMTK